MNSRDERMVQFRLAPVQVGRGPGEVVLLRVSQIMALFPEHRQIRTVEHGWTLGVYEEDWGTVERSFRSAYLGMPVHAQEVAGE